MISTQCQCNLQTMRFEVAGEVIGKGRPRFTRSSRTYTPKKTLDYERAIKRAYLNKYTYLSKRSLRIKICAYLEELQCTKKPDIDNITKIVLDALNKVAYQDDTQVVELVAIKRWSNESRLKVIIEEIGETMN